MNQKLIAQIDTENIQHVYDHIDESKIKIILKKNLIFYID